MKYIFSEAAEARLRNGQDLDKPKMSPSVSKRHNTQKNVILIHGLIIIYFLHENFILNVNM